MIPLEILFLGGFWLALALAAACMFVVVTGPAAVDRIVAVDLSIVLAAVALGLFAAATGTPAYLDVALLLATLSFPVTAILARLVETGEVFR